MRYNFEFHRDYAVLIDDQGNNIAEVYAEEKTCLAILKQLNAGHRATQKKAAKECPACKGSAHYTWYEGSFEPDRDGMVDFEIHVEHCAKCKGTGKIPA